MMFFEEKIASTVSNNGICEEQGVCVCLCGRGRGEGHGQLRILFVLRSLTIVTSQRLGEVLCHFNGLFFLDILASKWFLPEQDSAVPTSLSDKVSVMC